MRWFRVFNSDSDTRLPGDDYRSDMYYAAAHIRELIDRETGQTGYNGVLSPRHIRGVFRRYNGSGPVAEKYAADAINLFNGALNGTETLYFYQRRTNTKGHSSP
ncbi:MAG: hypothetical protein ABJN69_13050 [Hellea sp.]